MIHTTQNKLPTCVQKGSVSIWRTLDLTQFSLTASFDTINSESRVWECSSIITKQILIRNDFYQGWLQEGNHLTRNTSFIQWYLWLSEEFNHLEILLSISSVDDSPSSAELNRSKLYATFSPFQTSFGVCDRNKQANFFSQWSCTREPLMKTVFF
jgi:hypothetical protein